MREAILKIENISKSFKDNIVLDKMSFEIYRGEIFGIIGSSGTGKTTLLNTLIGFMQPDNGDISFNSSIDNGKFKSVFENQDLIKRKFGFASQVVSFYPKLTVAENLDFFGEMYDLPKHERISNINILLDLVELTNARNTYAENLSGGMQRRLDIACALIHDPSVLILDEPTSDLDPVLSRHIWKLLQRINKRGTTIIVASHNFPELEISCSRVGILSNGKFLQIGTIPELTSTLGKGQEMHIETYPGNYEKISRQLNDSCIEAKENRGSDFVIYTSKPEKALQKLLPVLSELNESLIDMSISRLSLNDVFSRATKKEQK